MAFVVQWGTKILKKILFHFGLVKILVVAKLNELNDTWMVPQKNLYIETSKIQETIQIKYIGMPEGVLNHSFQQMHDVSLGQVHNSDLHSEVKSVRESQFS